MTAPEWITIGSAAAAWCALIVAGLNVRTARRALGLAERQDALRAPWVELYLTKALSAQPKPQDHRLLACEIVATNPSASANAIVSTELHITYQREDAFSTTVRIPQLPASSVYEHFDGARLSTPASLDAHGAVAGLVCFRIEDELVAASAIDRYDLVVRDSHQIETSMQVVLFRGVTVEEA